MTERQAARAPRTIFVTGASRGLGAALVDGFVAEGHRVAGCARDEARMAELAARHGAPHRFDACDVADERSVASWASGALDALGAPDLLVCNAGVINAEAPLWEVDEAAFADVLAVNVAGVHRVIRHVLPAMLAAERGVVVNLSSGWGRSVSPGVAPYCASKWAIEGMTRALAAELPDGLAAVPLNPGVIDTDMLRTAWGDGASGYRTAAEWGRTAVPFLLGIGPEHNGQPLTVSS